MKSKLAVTRPTVLLGFVLIVGTLVTVQASHRNKFDLFGTATFAKDPTDQSNFVIKVDNTVLFGGVRREINTKISALDEHLTVRYYFVTPKTCGLGSPRIQLAIDRTGDGTLPTVNAHGAIGPSPTFTGCMQNQWVTEDLTISIFEGSQAIGRWDGGQLGCSAFGTWDDLKLCVNTLWPSHKVLRATLVEDAATPAGGGVSYYDDITLGERTLEDQQDVSGNK
jgi:hypothetical protein